MYTITRTDRQTDKHKDMGTHSPMEIIEAILAISNKEDQKDMHNGSDNDNCRLVVAYP